jgi:hypothetical protein
MISQKHPWKLDFNQATGKQMIQALKRIEKQYCHINHDLPIVSIGHSKLFNKYNEFCLEPLLKFISKNKHNYTFSTFNEIDIENF